MDDLKLSSLIDEYMMCDDYKTIKTHDIPEFILYTILDPCCCDGMCDHTPVIPDGRLICTNTQFYKSLVDDDLRPYWTILDLSYVVNPTNPDIPRKYISDRFFYYNHHLEAVKKKLQEVCSAKNEKDVVVIWPVYFW